jgi:hypothetical protein
MKNVYLFEVLDVNEELVSSVEMELEWWEVVRSISVMESERNVNEKWDGSKLYVWRKGEKRDEKVYVDGEFV